MLYKIGLQFSTKPKALNVKWVRHHRPSIEERLIYEHTLSLRIQHTRSHTNPQLKAYRVLVEQIWKNKFEQMALGKFVFVFCRTSRTRSEALRGTKNSKLIRLNSRRILVHLFRRKSKNWLPNLSTIECNDDSVLE